MRVHDIHIRSTIMLMVIALHGCTSTPAPPEPPHTAFDSAADLVGGWFAEIHQREPQSESALALFAWTFRYHTLITNGKTHEQARELTKHHAATTPAETDLGTSDADVDIIFFVSQTFIMK